EELLGFFSHYLTPNSFALTRSNVEWVGNTVLYAPAGSWNTSNSTYMALQLTAQNGDGSTIHAGDVLNVYAPFFQTNTRYVTINNNPLPKMPSWLSLTDVNGTQGIGNLYESPSQMVFGCDSVFASNATDPDISGATSALGTYLGSIEDSIAAAFNRGIASNFSIQPDNWASFPAISGNPNVSASGSSQITNEITYYYAVTAINVLGESMPGLVVPATLLPGQVATINWTQNPNPVPPSLSFNIYRGTTPDIGAMQLLQNVSGNTLTFTDIGAASSNPSTHPPFQYYAANSTSNWYSYFTQTNSSVDPVNGVSINGLSYGFAYADQGGLSTNAFFSTGNFPPSIGVHMGLVSGPEFITQLLADATQSQSYSQQIQVSGNVSNLSYSITSGSLPVGLTLNPNTGIISGTLTATAATSTFTIQVSGKEDNSPFAPISRSFMLTVNSSQPASQSLTISGLTVPISGPSYLTLEPVSLGIAAGSASQSYTRTISVSGGTGPYTLTPTTSIGAGQVLYTQFPINTNTPINSLNNVFTLTTVNPLTLGSGQTSITFEIKDSATPTPNTIQFILNTNILPALSINVPSTPTAYVGIPYYQKLQTNQNPIQVPEYPWGELTYSLANGSSLPPGLTLTPWGVIQGTPTTSSGSPFSYTVQVTNQVTGVTETATASLSMNVQLNSSYTALAITNPGTLLPVLGTTYNSGSPLATITTTGGSGGVQLELINGQLPTGLIFDNQTGKITGTVSASSPGGDFSITFRAIDIQGHIAYQNVTISVTSISPPSTQSGGVPIPYDVYQATSSLIIPGTGFNAITFNDNLLTVGSISTTILNSTTLNELAANLNSPLPLSGTINLNLAVNGGTQITSNGYANIRSNPTITQSTGNLAQNSSTLYINGTNFGTGNSGTVPFGGYRYFINATNVTNEAQLILTDSHGDVIPYSSIGNGNYSTTMEISGLNLSNAAAGDLNAKLVVNGQTIFGPTPVGTIVAANAPPTINFNQNNTTYLTNAGPTYTVLITGSGFQPFSGSAVTVDLKNDAFQNITVTSTQVLNDNSLLVTFSGTRPTNLFARVFVNGVGSAANTTDQTPSHYPSGYVQVASLNSSVGEINSNPAIAINGTQFIIYGQGFVPPSLNQNAPTSVSSLQYLVPGIGFSSISSSNYTSVCLTPNIILVTLNGSIQTLAPSGIQINATLQNPSQGGTNGFLLFNIAPTINQTQPTITPYTGSSPNPISNDGYSLSINGSNFGTAVSSTGSVGNTFVQLYLGNSTTTPLFSFINSFFSTAQGSMNNGTGVQDVTINGTTAMTVNLAGSLPVGDIYAVVTTQGVSSSLTKVATIASSASTPTITSSTQKISLNPTRIIINGTNFDTNGSNLVTLSQGTVVSVTADSSTQLVAIVDGITTPGALNASVVVNGVSSGNPVQVADVVAGGPDIKFSIGNLSPSATRLVITGSNFSPTSANNTVTLYSQAGAIANAVTNVVANGNNQLTITIAPNTLQNIPAGQLYATVSVSNTLSDTVQVAYVASSTLPAPTVTTNTGNLSQNASTLVINGTNFDPTGTNVLTLTDSGSAAVPYASVVVNSPTQITVSFSSAISISGALFAQVETDGVISNRAQVATVVTSTVPTITQSISTIAANATSLTIFGSGFDTSSGASNHLELSSGSLTSVQVISSSQLIATLNPSAGLLDPGILTATVTVNGERAGPTQVATVNAVPVITPSSALLPANASTMYIYGTGFSTTPGNNTVALSSGSGTVTGATTTKLTVTLVTAPTAGNLTATVVSNGVSSQAAVINSVQPVITQNTLVIDQQTSTTITINGVGFDSDKTKNSVVLSSGAGVVTAATSTQLTFQFSSQPALGNLLATVTSNGVASTQTQIATVGTKKITLATPAAGAVDGQAFATQPVITFLDASGQRIQSDSTSVVTMAVSTGATTVGTVTATAVNGQATFATVGIDGTPGSQYTLTFTSPNFQTTSQLITLSANTATQLGFSQQAIGASSGQAFTTQPIITILDSQGHLVSNDNTSLISMSVSGGATTVGTVTLRAVNGVVNFTNAGISGTSGIPYTLTFSSGSLTPATQSITINPGAPTQISLFTAAAGAVDNTAFTTQPVLRILDHFGQIVTSDNFTQVTISVNNSGALIGTFTKTAVNGVVTFTNVGIDGVSGANYTLTYAANGLTSTQQSIQLTPNDNPTKLGIVTPASGSTNGQAFTIQPVISIQNNAGSVVPSSAIVTMTVSNGAQVIGVSTATGSNGVATFGNVGISGATGITYTLTFSSNGLTSVTQPIVISPLVPSKIGFSAQASGASDARPFVVQPVLLIQNSAGQTVTTDNTTSITMNVSTGATTIGTITQTAVNGTVT
ncbi:MAG: hypothetical protein EBQ87_00670, partial [Planctomycetes bacterium]|nr:hypothetical protein [Planctomycetota bacterium]